MNNFEKMHDDLLREVYNLDFNEVVEELMQAVRYEQLADAFMSQFNNKKCNIKYYNFDVENKYYLFLILNIRNIQNWNEAGLYKIRKSVEEYHPRLDDE